MGLSTPKKVLFGLIAILIPLIMIEMASYGILRLVFPEAYLASKKSSRQPNPAFRTNYQGNDFSQENHDYSQDFFGPHLQDTSLGLSARLIGPRAVDHYVRIDHYTLFPFTMFHFQRNYRSAIVNTNQLGFRARELSSYAQDRQPKILILGGSAIFGTNLTADAKTISARLEAFLRQGGKEVTCINLAMGGYTSEQEMINLSRLGLRLQPAMVIAIDGYNDIFHSLSHRDLPHLFPRLADLFYRGIPPNSPPANYVRALINHWGRYSSFFGLAGALAAKPWAPTAQDRFKAAIDNSILFPERTDQEAIVDNYLNAHRVMFDLCQSRNIQYIAGLQPVCGLWIEPRWEGEKDQTILGNKKFVEIYTLLDTRMTALAQEKGFRYINFGKVLAESDNTFNFSDVVHLTDYSSEIIARRLAEANLRPSPGRPEAGLDRSTP